MFVSLLSFIYLSQFKDLLSKYFSQCKCKMSFKFKISLKWSSCPHMCIIHAKHNAIEVKKKTTVTGFLNNFHAVNMDSAEHPQLSNMFYLHVPQSQ